VSFILLTMAGVYVPVLCLGCMWFCFLVLAVITNATDCLERLFSKICQGDVEP